MLSLDESLAARGLTRDQAREILLNSLPTEETALGRAGVCANLAALYIDEGRPDLALFFANAALSEDATNIAARANHSIASLALGHWERGWKDYRATALLESRPKRFYGLPEWDGANDRTVIVWGDEGLGDEIMFANCLPDLIARCSVIFDCHPRLRGLFVRSFPDARIYGQRKNAPTRYEDANAQIRLADLSWHFRRYGRWNGNGYLTPDRTIYDPTCTEDKKWHWLPKRIGISWAGGTAKTHADRRSISLMEMEPIVRALPDAEWYSLQYAENGPVENASRAVCEFEEKTGIRVRHYPGWVECYDYDRTASFAASLDLIITVCTTMHHLGGALGIPTWTMVPSRPSWRYGVRGETLPWYNSARLFRQDKEGDWSGVVSRIALELKASYGS